MRKILIFMSLFFICAASNAAATYINLIGYNPVEDGAPSRSDVFVDNIGDRTISSYDSTYFGYLGADLLGSWSGYYLGTIDGNDNKNLADAISHYIGITPTSIDKIDAPATSRYLGSFTITYASDKKSGSWSTTDPLNNAIQFYTVKGSTNYALYFLDPAQTVGYWSTIHLINGGANIPEISHISATFTIPNPVPEPTAMLLVGTGLAGLVGFARNKKK